MGRCTCMLLAAIVAWPGFLAALLTHPQVLCGSADQLAEARHEVDVMRRLGRRPCLLPLLEAAVSEQRLEGGEARQVVLMLFPGAGRTGGAGSVGRAGGSFTARVGAVSS